MSTGIVILQPLAALGAVILAFLTGCAAPYAGFGAHVLPEEQGLQTPRPLIAAGDSNIAAALDAVIVRNGAGSWARNASWDEYRLRIRATGERPLHLVRITLFDALGEPVASTAERSRLVDESLSVRQRYNADPLNMAGGGVEADEPLAKALERGAVKTAAIAMASLVAGPAGPVGVLLIQAPGLAAEGLFKLGSSYGVAVELEKRQTPLPAPIGAADLTVVAFFPVVPKPSAIELSYLDAGTEHHLRIGTQAALSETHSHLARTLEIVSRAEANFPPEAAGKKLDRGRVTATLVIGSEGNVESVEDLQASSPEFIREARNAFQRYQYNRGASDRRAPEGILFWRTGPRTSVQSAFVPDPVPGARNVRP